MRITGLTRKFWLPVRAPPGVVKETTPVVAPLGTVPVRQVSETTVKVALVPLKLTLEVPVSHPPRIPTAFPTFRNVGTVLTNGLRPTSRL